METVLTLPRESAKGVDSPRLRQNSKQTRSKKKSTISSNGDHPSKAFLSPQPKIDVESAADESEGWRYIEKAGKNGQVEYERVPLTTYELLHPKEGYTIVHASPHDINTAYIGNSAKINLRGTPEARVFGDLRTDLNLLGIEPVSPDVSVMFDVSQEQIWTTFNCQKEGIYPSIVFEVTSPGTRNNDFEKKYDYYCRAGIPYYVILDIQYSWDGPVRVADYALHVFERINGQYEDIQANSEGKYWLPPLKMWVGLDEKGILCYDEEGRLLLAPEELVDILAETEIERNAAIEQADEQKQIAQQESSRAAEQERIAQQEASRAAEQEQIAQQERMIAQQEASRAAEQEHIAQAALQAQLEAEARVAELLAQMAELQDKA